jgi:glycerol-3-phosphate acyltransferase PlsY
VTAAMIPWLLASYLLGAIPTSYITARLFRHIDLREHGSRNLGATNLYRVLGWRYALPVGLLDMAKGLIPVLLFAPRASQSQLFGLICGMMAVLGHVYSVFVRFRGGKGVATAAGVMLALTPAALGASFAVWFIVVGLTGYVSLGSILSAAVFPLAVWVLDPPEQAAIFWLDIAVAAAIIWLHRGNIRRLLKGTENRFGRRGAPAGTR